MTAVDTCVFCGFLGHHDSLPRENAWNALLFSGILRELASARISKELELSLRMTRYHFTYGVPVYYWYDEISRCNVPRAEPIDI